MKPAYPLTVFTNLSIDCLSTSRVFATRYHPRDAKVNTVVTRFIDWNIRMVLIHVTSDYSCRFCSSTLTDLFQPII